MRLNKVLLLSLMANAFAFAQNDLLTATQQETDSLEKVVFHVLSQFVAIALFFAPFILVGMSGVTAWRKYNEAQTRGQSISPLSAGFEGIKALGIWWLIYLGAMVLLGVIPGVNPLAIYAKGFSAMLNAFNP